MLNLSQVRNFGPSVVDESKVTITVPKLLRKSDPESYLIYLLQVEVRNFLNMLEEKYQRRGCSAWLSLGGGGGDGGRLASELIKK